MPAGVTSSVLNLRSQVTSLKDSLPFLRLRNSVPCVGDTLNRSGSFSIEASYEVGGEFSEGFAMVLVEVANAEYKVGFIDNLGRMRIPPKYFRLDDVYESKFSEGLTAVKTNHRW